MAYSDYLRSHVRIERQLAVGDGNMGTTTSWVPLSSVPCRASTVSSEESMAYRREGYVNVVRLMLDDRMSVAIGGVLSLYSLLTAEDSTKFRFVFDGRVIVPVSIKYQSLGMHDYASKYITLDCSYTVEDTGYVDA